MLWDSLGITDLDVTMDSRHSDRLSAHMVHRTEDGSGSMQFSLPLERQSKGTQQILSLLGTLINALDKGAVLLIDDIDANLHIILAINLVIMIQNLDINTEHAQLIVTARNERLLDPRFMQFDQMWAIHKEQKTLATELFPLMYFSRSAKRKRAIKTFFKGVMAFFGVKNHS